MTTTLNRPGEPVDEAALAHRQRQPIGSWLYFRHEMQSFLDRMWDNFQRHPRTPLDEFPPPNDVLALDIEETESEITLRTDLPDHAATDVNVEVSGNVLTIGIAPADKSDHDGNPRARVAGLRFRSITLPAYVDPDKTDARFKDGTLTIHVPRIPGAGPKRIPVKT